MANAYCRHCNLTLEQGQACHCLAAKDERAKWFRSLLGDTAPAEATSLTRHDVAPEMGPFNPEAHKFIPSGDA